MRGSSVFKILVALIIVVFVGHQSIAAIYKPIKTESAVYYTAIDGFKITGVIIRNETLVKSGEKGTLHFAVKDGGRVSKNGTIANIYENESASVNISRISEIKNKIADIEDILSYNDIEAANLEAVNTRVNKAVKEFIYSTSQDNFGNSTECSEELLSAINRRQAALGEETNLDVQLKSLKAELSELSQNLPTAKGKIAAASSGYFVSKADGYENVLKASDISGITPEFLDEIKPEEVSKGVIGKIVSDYEWYIAAQVKVSDSLKYKEGETLKLLTSVKSSPELKVTVKKINVSSASDNAVIIFTCNEMNNELAFMRTGPMTVVRAEYSGLKVPRKALRVVDSVRGVYVVNGMQVKFVPVNIIHSTDSYIICEKQTDNENILKLYDSVVVKGKNLYDGKIIG